MSSNRLNLLLYGILLLGGVVSSQMGTALADESHSATQQLSAEFQRDIFPLLQRGSEGASCVACHDAATNSDLEFVGEADDDFQMLLAGGYFSSERPDALLGRITSSNPKRRMPKGKDAVSWSDLEVNQLRAFIAKVEQRLSPEGSDEEFPPALLRPYQGESRDVADTQFLTYTQLRGKVRTLFDDDWIRGGVDRFRENISLFGGADFEDRFNESAQATSGYMSALRLMARDVAERAFVARKGPFADASFFDLASVDRSQALRSLYRYVLQRDPSVGEVAAADELYRSMRAQASQLETRPYELRFQLSVSDHATGLAADRELVIPVSNQARSLYQERLDLRDGVGKQGKVAHLLPQPFQLKVNDSRQALVLSVLSTLRRVVITGVLLEHVDAKTVEWIGVDDDRVRLDGSWKLSEGREVRVAELDPNGDLSSQITFPLSPDIDGSYRLTVFTRSRNQSRSELLAEVWHSGESSHLVSASSGPEWEQGQVRFHFDGTIDTVSHIDFQPQFRFAPKDFVEINNGGTTGKVAVGPVGFLGTEGLEFEIDTKDAEGFSEWSPFKSISFNAYNNRGTRVEDRNERKGELFLRYVPSSSTSKLWSSEDFYRLRVFYPGKRDHEPRTPVYVQATASSPIIRLGLPKQAVRGSRVRLDASESFTTQGSELAFQWKQLGGLPVGELPDSATVEFTVPSANLEYHYWVALTQALMRHPDFLFTRSSALDWVTSPEERWRLNVSRVSLDLIGRVPNPEEWLEFDSHRNWEEVVDTLLSSDDFKAFYQHRIRLYLESQGTEEQDEPVRLWCYVAFNDRPFQEILTADYTVDSTMKPSSRPQYHGRTGLLSAPGFIAGKPGLPHYNYAAQVSMLFLGYRYEVPADIVEQREGVTPLGTTDPNSACYSCHKILTPLAFQRNFWTDDGRYRLHDEYGLPIEASDHGLVSEYPFKGEGLEAFALQAVKKERFIRTMIDTHFDFLFGRSLRYRTDERELYKRLWDAVHEDGFKIKGLLRALATSPEYLK